VTIGTQEHYAHVLARYSDTELKHLVQLATRRRTGVHWITSTEFSGPGGGRGGLYKEAQFHGEVRFTDFEAVFVHGRHREDKALCAKIELFCQKHQLNFVFMER
jgi:hypothetical protein